MVVFAPRCLLCVRNGFRVHPSGDIAPEVTPIQGQDDTIPDSPGDRAQRRQTSAQALNWTHVRYTVA